MARSTSSCNEHLEQHYSFSSDIDDVRFVLRQILADLAAENLTDDQAGFAEILLAEIINNIIEHGYQYHRSRPINLSVQCTSNQLIYKFIDSGRSMPGTKIPDPKPSTEIREPANLPEGGFGWGIIHELANEISYRRIDGKNYLKVTTLLN